MKIYPAKSLHGTIHLPGDKSISHRAAFLAAMAIGDTRIENFSTAKDCQTTLDRLRELGVAIDQNGTEVHAKGVGKKGFRKPEKPLDCGNSGTTMRLLAGILAGQEFKATLIGDESLSKRPMQRVIDPLEKMGAIISSNDGKPPLTISGLNPLRSIEHEQNIASAQIKSSILLAALNSDGDTSVTETILTRDHTERMLEWFDVKLRTSARKDWRQVTISGNEVPKPHDVIVPSDISSAAFFIAAAACLKGSNIELPNVGLNRTRAAFCDLVFDVCSDAENYSITEICNERVGTINVYGGLVPPDETVLLQGQNVAQMIDELPIIAILGTQLEHGIEVYDAQELRVKETDRIAAITENLKRMGANVTEFDDGFKVERSRLKGAVVDSFGDHRIAMAFAVAGLLADSESEILGAECVDISFPGFFEVLAAATRST